MRQSIPAHQLATAVPEVVCTPAPAPVARFQIGPVRRRGRPRSSSILPTASEARLLALLDRPRHGSSMPALLGVTRERVRQLLVRLLDKGLIRAADARQPTFLVALQGDPSPLLRQDQERVLSSLPQSALATLGKIAGAAGMRIPRTAPILEALREAGLIEAVETLNHARLYRLTQAGASHWQRRPRRRRAAAPPPPPLPVRSARVCDVLRFMQAHQPTAGRDLAKALGLPHASLNALMQYLKRKGVIRNVSAAPREPYILTAYGREVLAELQVQMTTAAPASVPEPLAGQCKAMPAAA
jgi:DNA-binding MarR family transcriptional regulator